MTPIDSSLLNNKLKILWKEAAANVSSISLSLPRRKVKTGKATEDLQSPNLDTNFEISVQEVLNCDL